MDYLVKDIGLAEQGLKNMELAERSMKALAKVRKRFKRDKPLEGEVVGIALHITKETGILVRTLRDGGAKVVIASCNPQSTQDDVAAALAGEGINVYGYKGESDKVYYECVDAVIAKNPTITIDDGCDLVARIHELYPEKIENIKGGSEETTTGVERLRAMERDNILEYAVIAVNDNLTKHLVDNYYGTGQSTIDGIVRASNVLLAGKTFVVAGYGNCGKGLALRAKGLGANVIVTEVDNVEALRAKLDGYRVMPMIEAAEKGDIFVTVTGCKDVIAKKHMRLMKDGAILANSGHFDCEINVKSLKRYAKSSRRMRPMFDEYLLPDGRCLYLAGEGRLVNLAAAEGHPSEVMDLSFCGQALAVEYVAKNDLEPGVIKLPREIDDEIAGLYLDVNKVKIDKLTKNQEKYLNDWREGT